MILKNERYNIGNTALWRFRIECDKCKTVAGCTMYTREEAQQFMIKRGWRKRPRARKYFHLCGQCANKGRPSGQRINTLAADAGAEREANVLRQTTPET